MADVEVPEAFAAIGFSGLFHQRCTFESPEVAARWRAKAPCLVHGDRWALISVSKHPTASSGASSATSPTTPATPKSSSPPPPPRCGGCGTGSGYRTAAPSKPGR